MNSTIVFVAILAAIFAAWCVSEKTLSIHSIYTPRREAFYWGVVIVTFALGTALGDMTADTFGLGTLPVSVILAAMIAGFVIYLSITHADVPMAIETKTATPIAKNQHIL